MYWEFINVASGRIIENAPRISEMHWDFLEMPKYFLKSTLISSEAFSYGPLRQVLVEKILKGLGVRIQTSVVC